MASVHNLFRAPKKHLPMEELREAQILADFGLKGCSHAQSGGRNPPSAARRSRNPRSRGVATRHAERKHHERWSECEQPRDRAAARHWRSAPGRDRKSTRLNSSHVAISYAVFCLRPPSPHTTLFPYTTLFRSERVFACAIGRAEPAKCCSSIEKPSKPWSCNPAC